MSTVIRDVNGLERPRIKNMNRYINPRKGIIAFLILLSGLVWVEFFGNPFAFFTTMIGLLLFSIYDISAPTSSRLKEIVIHGSVSILCTPLAIISGNHLITSILFLFSAVFLSSMAMMVGNRLTKSLFMTNAWLMIALAVSGNPEKALTASLCLLGGGSAYVIFSSIVRIFSSAQSPEVPSFEEFVTAKAQLCSHLSPTSPVLQFALLRSLSVSAALLIGWQLFESAPFWMAYTVFFVIRPGLNYSLKPAIERGIGTLLGTLLAYYTISMMGADSIQIKILLLIALSVCIAEGGTRYFLFVTLLTYALLLYLEVSGMDRHVMGNKRLLATLMGICMALLTTIALQFLPRLFQAQKSD